MKLFPRSTSRRRVLLAAIVALCAGVFVEGYRACRVLILNRELFASTTRRWSVEEERRLLHEVARHRLGNDHDACVRLIEIGNEESLPYLEVAMSRYPWVDGVADCTRVHCEEARDRILGVRPAKAASPEPEGRRTEAP